MRRLRHFACALVWLVFAAAAWASPFHGAVTYGGLPLPGATVTVTHDGKKLTAITDQGGLYHFDDLPDGVWTIQVDMQCFEPIRTDVTVGANVQPGNFEMKLLPVDQLMAKTKLLQNPILPVPELKARPEEKNPNRLPTILHPRCRSHPKTATSKAPTVTL